MAVKDTTQMIAGMTPVLAKGDWVYCCETNADKVAALANNAFAVVKEAEGTTLILPADVATANRYDTALQMRLITLNVFSDLEGIGLTAAVAQALTDAGIACNVVAAYHHDHVFVPESDAETALSALQKLQRAPAKE